jgi:hypothetical protein
MVRVQAPVWYWIFVPADTLNFHFSDESYYFVSFNPSSENQIGTDYVVVLRVPLIMSCFSFSPSMLLNFVGTLQSSVAPALVVLSLSKIA